MRSHALAKELLSRPDDFLTATCEDRNGEREFVIESYKRKAIHANMDDGVAHWSLILRDCGKGNIKRWN